MRIAPHCVPDFTRADGHRPSAAWPADAYVQWGVHRHKDQTSAFFEALIPQTSSPGASGVALLRGEGTTLVEAEKNAQAHWTAQSACAHRWRRGGHTNGRATCALCGANRKMFKPLVALGTWNAPFGALDLELLDGGYAYPGPNDPPDTALRRRRHWLRARVAGWPLPAPDQAAYPDRLDYIRATRALMAARPAA